MVLLKQTTEEIGDSPSALSFTSERLLDLGGYLNIISGHESKTKLKFIFEPKIRKRTRSILKYDGARIGFTYGHDGRDGAKLLLIELYLDPSKKPTFTFRPSRKQIIGDAQDLGIEPNILTFHLTSINRSSPHVTQCYQRFLRARSKLRESLTTFPPPSDNPGIVALLGLFKDDHINIAGFISAALTYARPFLFQPSAFRILTPEQTRTPKELFQWFMQSAAQSTDPRRNNSLLADLSLLSDLLDVGFQEARELTSFLSREIRSITYIGPLRQFPRRTYAYSRASQNDVGFSGEHFPNLIYSEDGSLLERLNALADQMHLGYKLKILRSRDKAFSKTFAIALTDETTGIEVGIADVGFGVSQVLPILLQCILGTSGITIIEQPEIHLNPRLQAELGSILATAISAKTSRDTTRPTFVVETHSEHMLLRLGNCVKRGLLSANDISVLFVSKSLEGSTVHAIPIDDVGQMTEPWPDDRFFDDTFLEMFGDARVSS